MSYTNHTNPSSQDEEGFLSWRQRRHTSDLIQKKTYPGPRELEI